MWADFLGGFCRHVKKSWYNPDFSFVLDYNDYRTFENYILAAAFSLLLKHLIIFLIIRSP